MGTYSVYRHVERRSKTVVETSFFIVEDVVHDHRSCPNEQSGITPLSQSDEKGGLILHKEMIFNHHDCKMGVFKTLATTKKKFFVKAKRTKILRLRSTDDIIL